MSCKEFVSVGTLAALASITTIAAPRAWAQWNVTNLHPVGATNSIAYATSGGQQAGIALIGKVRSASLWSGTAASWVNLNPAGATDSFAYAISGGQQAGYAKVAGPMRAGL